MLHILTPALPRHNLFMQHTGRCLLTVSFFVLTTTVNCPSTVPLSKNIELQPMYRLQEEETGTVGRTERTKVATV